MKRISKRTTIINLFIFSFICIIIRILYLDTGFDVNNVSCYSEPGDELPHVDDKFRPEEQSIFFLETSCKGGLNSRQACTIETAARLHPLRDIHVFFVSPVRVLNHKTLVTLKKYGNIKFSRLNLEQYAKGTPIDEWVTRGAWIKSTWRIIYASDLLRFLTLYKWGGIYLDLDTVVVKSLDDLGPNWGAKESNTAVAVGAMAFSNDELGRIIAENAIWDLVTNWRDNNWGNTGPGIITRVLTHMCDTQQIYMMNAKTCHGFEVYSQEKFYPIKWYQAGKYFEPPNATYPNAYAHHIWNHVTHNKNVVRGSLYDLLAKEHCPYIHMAYGEQFGM